MGAILADRNRAEVDKTRRGCETVVRVLPDAIIEKVLLYKLLDEYHDKIIARDEKFMLEIDYAGKMQSAQLKKDKITEWVDFIMLLKMAWSGMDARARTQMWETIDRMYCAYCEYATIMATS